MSNNKENKDLGYFKNLQYDIVIKKRKNRFVLFIPELAIVEEDENLEKAYEKLESEKEKYFSRLQRDRENTSRSKMDDHKRSTYVLRFIFDAVL